MPVTVIVRSGGKPKNGPAAESLSITFDAPMVVIGRGEGSEVRLPDPSVSHRHATIRQRGNEYILVDEGSSNGTFMGGVKLGAQAPRILRHGDLARVGKVWLEIRFDARPPSGQTVLATKELALALVARALDAQGEEGGPRIVVSEGPDQSKTLQLLESGRAYVIGRGQDVDLVLDDADASRRHVQVVRRADLLVVRDLGSKNGAQLGGVPLGERERVWSRTELLRIGKNAFLYQHAAVEALAELERAADEVLRPNEPIAPPEPASPADSSLAAGRRESAAPPASAGEIPLADAAHGPMAELPQGRPRTTQRRRGGWNGTDWLVVLLALSVLTLSILGLYWLLRA
jgi:pSer/pThr/pTyr-binding forkhead associated (FHA) protein